MTPTDGNSDGAGPEAWTLDGLSAQILDQVGEGVAAFDESGYLIYANPALAELNDVALKDLRGVHFSAFNSLPEGVTLEQFRMMLAAQGVWRLERPSRMLNGALKQVTLNLSVLYGRSGDIVGHVVCVHDLTDRNALRDELYRAATHDELTGLLNRAELQVRLEAKMQDIAQPLAVVFIDLDDFKPVNDVHGHAAGDHMLVAVAERLRESVRTQDLVARLGGDEFLLVLSGLKRDRDLRVIVDRLTAQFARPFMISDLAVQVGVSCGVARWCGDDVRSLLARADAAMYAAKAAGGHQAVYAS